MVATNVAITVLRRRSGKNNCRQLGCSVLAIHWRSPSSSGKPALLRSLILSLRSWVRTQYGDSGHNSRT
jgi:hypothetical protein